MASSSFSFNKTLDASQSLQANNNSYESDTHALLVANFKVSTNNADHDYEVVGHKAETQLADYDNDEMHVILKPKFKTGATETVTTETVTVYVEPEQLWIG